MSEKYFIPNLIFAFSYHYIAYFPCLCVASIGPLTCDVKAEVGSKWRPSTIVNLGLGLKLLIVFRMRRETEVPCDGAIRRAR